MIAVSGSVLVPLLLSAAVTLLLEPLVDWFELKTRSRPAAVLLSMFSALAAVAVVLLFLVPSIFHQLSESVEKLPLALRAAADRAQSLLMFAKAHLSSDLFDRLQSMISGFQDDPSALTSRIGGWLSKGLLGLVNIGSAGLGLIIVPFFIYYLLLDLHHLRLLVERHIPPRHQAAGSRLLNEIGAVVRGYIRGRFLIAVIMASIYSIGLLIIGVPLWAAIGAIAGFIGIIPYLGVFSGLLLAFGFAAMSGSGVQRLIGVAVVFSIAQLVEDYVLTPRIIGGKLELHPMLVFLALLIAGDLFGLLGLVLAIPVLAVIKVLVRFMDELYLQSDLYRAPAFAPSRPPLSSIQQANPSTAIEAPTVITIE
jgi:predicted PurR-regulated permease PerM